MAVRNSSLAFKYQDIPVPGYSETRLLDKVKPSLGEGFLFERRVTPRGLAIESSDRIF